MANIKISQLSPASTLLGTEIIPIVQSGSTVITTTQDIANIANSNITASLLNTASVSLNTITFTKGNGSTFNITVNTGSATPTGSLLTTASVSGNTLTFTKGNGSTFNVTISTGSGISTPGGSIQFNSGSLFKGSSNFIYYFPSESLQQGYIVTASGQYSHAEGSGTKAIGIGSHAEGAGTTATGQSSHAEGLNTISSGSYSHAEGNQTTALGYISHAEGYQTIASGDYSHAEGWQTQATNIGSHAEGIQSVASGQYSHAEGYNNQAIGNGSHVEGAYTTASGLHSHAEGYFTVASGTYQHVQGQFNLTSSAQSAFIIGNGTSGINRSNLVFASGSEFQVTGSVFITDILNLPFQNPLPSNKPTGSVALSGSGGTFVGMFVYNGTSWTSV